MACIALAALSARAMAQAAVAEGLDAVALDAFGDADTLGLLPWRRIGQADPPRLHAQALLAALDELAASGALGWVAGAGLDGAHDLVAEGARRLPLLGCSVATRRALRQPAQFFATLARLGLPHPEVNLAQAPAGWLIKDAAGCGGVHIQRAVTAQVLDTHRHPGIYAQNPVPGWPGSATFAGDGRRAQLLGLNRQFCAADGLGFEGVAGPLAGADRPAWLLAAVTEALQALVPAFGLVGLASLDFMVDDDAPGGPRWWLLEINPRPGASLVLHAPWRPLEAHVQACRGRLPTPPAGGDGPLRGEWRFHAPRDLTLSPRAAAWLAAQAWVHDRPRPGTALRGGEPLCSFHAQAADLGRLGLERRRLQAVLEAGLEAELEAGRDATPADAAPLARACRRPPIQPEVGAHFQCTFDASSHPPLP